MEIGFRWHGPSDLIPLKYIHQIPGIDNIVGSFFSIPPEELIPEHNILNLKKYIEEYGFTFKCIESLPVHECIKLGKPERDEYIDIWCENLRLFAAAGIDTVCYNFMLAVDWLRTDLYLRLADDSTTNAYNHNDLGNIDIYTGLPDWSQAYSLQEINDVLRESRSLSEEQFWQNLDYFLKAVIPVAESVGIKLALHPDDPPWEAMGIVRPLGTREGLQKVIETVDSPSNGIAFCSGTLAVHEDNDVYEMLKHFGKLDRVNYFHLRNVLVTGDKEFQETAHCSDYGDLDMFRLLKILYDMHYDGTLSVDHGRNIWDEDRKPGYGLYDRALGVSYVTGILEALAKG